MTQKEVLDELKGLVVERLKFDPRRAADMTLETTLPKGVEGSLGLDSLDFNELSVALEERFGIVIDEGRDLETAVYLSLFLDAPAQPGDDVPPDSTRRGFWADAYSADGDVTGSRLWLLERSKVTAVNVANAKTYAEEALAWMEGAPDGIPKGLKDLSGGPELG